MAKSFILKIGGVALILPILSFADDIKRNDIYKLIDSNQLDSALNQAIYYKKNQIEEEGQVNAHLLLGEIYRKLNNPSKSIESYKDAIKISNSKGLENLLYYSFSGIALTYSEAGYYKKALEAYLNSIKNLTSEVDSFSVASTYNALASTYRKTGNYIKAETYYLKALKVWRNDPVRRSSVLNNLGNLSKNLNRYGTSILYHTQSLNIAYKINSHRKISIYSLNLGDLYLQTGQLDSSEYYSKIAYRLKDSLNDRKGLAIVSNNLGNLYIIKKEWDKVSFYLDQAEQLAAEISELEALRENYKLWSDYYEKRNDPQLALDYQRRLLVIKDSLLSQEKVRAISELQIQFETEQKELEIAFLNQQKETQNALIDQQNLFIWFLAISSILFLILGAWAYKSYKAKQRAHGKIELLLRELHHRVKNNLQMISSILSLQSEKLSDQKAKAAIKESEMRVNAMNLLHQRLYMNGTGSEIGIREYLNDLIADLTISYSGSKQNVTLESSIDSVQIDVEKAIPFGLITSELISNAYKHAFNESGKGKISVSLKEKDKKLRLEISDDGKGFETSDKNTEHSFGLRMVDILCQQLRAKKHFSNGKGSRFEFEVDVKP